MAASSQLAPLELLDALPLSIITSFLPNTDLFPFALTSRACREAAKADARFVNNSLFQTDVRALVASDKLLRWGVFVGAPKRTLLLQATIANNTQTFFTGLELGCVWNRYILYEAADRGYLNLLSTILCVSPTPLSMALRIKTIEKAPTTELFNALRQPGLAFFDDRVSRNLMLRRLGRFFGMDSIQDERTVEFLDVAHLLAKQDKTNTTWCMQLIHRCFDWSNTTIIEHAIASGMVDTMLERFASHEPKQAWFEIFGHLTLKLTDAQVLVLVKLAVASKKHNIHIVAIIRDACIRGACRDVDAMKTFLNPAAIKLEMFERYAQAIDAIVKRASITRELMPWIIKILSMYLQQQKGNAKIIEYSANVVTKIITIVGPEVTDGSDFFKNISRSYGFFLAKLCVGKSKITQTFTHLKSLMITEIRLGFKDYLMHYFNLSDADSVFQVARARGGMLETLINLLHC
jgi:hypothetical protein